MEYRHSVQQIKKQILAKLEHNYGVGLENATNDQLYKSVALIAREMMEQGRSEFIAEAEKKRHQAGLLPLHGILAGAQPEKYPV